MRILCQPPRIALLCLTVSVLLAGTQGCTCGGAGLTTKFGEIGVVAPSPNGPVISREATYNFGKVLVGESRPLTMVVRNVGAGRLSLVRLTPLEGDPVVFGPDAVPGTPFTIDFAPTALDESGAEARFSMWFSPLVASKRFAATLELFAEGTPDGEASATIILLGESQPGSCVVPSEIDFGSVPVGETYFTALSITNAGTVPGPVFVGSIDGADALTFSLTTTSRGEFTLQPQQSASLRFSFSPTERRPYLAHIQLKGAGPCAVVDVAIKGVGSDEVLSWRPPELDFGYVPLEGAVTRDVVFANPAKASVTLTEIKASLAPFSVESSTFEVLGGGTLSMLHVTCKPTQLGALSGLLTFSTGLKRVPTGSVKLRCNGGGPKIRVTPMELRFGAMPTFAGAPTPFPPRVLRVSNVGSTAMTPAGNLFLGSVNAMGSYGMLPLLEVKPMAGTLAEEVIVEMDPTYNKQLMGISATAGNNSIDLKVTLAPKSHGLKAAEIRIYSNDTSQPVVTVPVSGEALNLPACNYEVTPTQLNFGVITDPVVEKTITITNLGAGPLETCRISHLALSSTSHAAYSLVGQIPDEKTLGPQESWAVTVRVAPASISPERLIDLSGEVVFEVPSPTRPRASVKLLANVGPTCLVANDPIDFGVVKVGCNSQTRSVVIYNTCPTSVGLNAFEMVAGTSPEFSFAMLPTVPADGILLEPGASTVIQIRYRPVDVGFDDGVVSISTRHQYNVGARHLLKLRGQGSATGVSTDTFTQDLHPKVDVLVVIDDSGSMANKQMSLQMNFAAFLSVAGLATADYHVGITTTTSTTRWCDPYGNCTPATSKAPAGLLYRDDEVGPVLTNATPDVDAKFALMVSRLGTRGASHEKGLDSALLALTPPKSLLENAGFLRDDAALAVIVVSDAGDESDLPLGYYVDRLRTLKGARTKFLTFHNIGPYQPTDTMACPYDGSGDVTRYQTLAQQTGGITDEICTSDWAGALNKIGQKVFTFPSRFFLSGTPNVPDNGLPEVLVDGQPLASTEWSYDPASNTVTLGESALPTNGQTLTIRYTPACF